MPLTAPNGNIVSFEGMSLTAPNGDMKALRGMSLTAPNGNIINFECEVINCSKRKH